MPKTPTKRKRPITPRPASDCIIAPTIPVDALSGLLFEQDEKSVEQISAYVEQQSRGETVTHAEKVMSQLFSDGIMNAGMFAQIRPVFG
jgi:hypothetical protein